MPGIPSKNSEQAGPQPAPRRTLVHPAAAALLIVVDALWTIPDMDVFAWIVTIPLCFLAVAGPTFFIQRSVGKDSTLHALLKAAVLGILAAIPTPIMGTAVGTILLTITGLRSLGGQK